MESKIGLTIKMDTYLTPSECRVLNLIANGYNGTEIAKMLFVSYETIKTHKQHIKQKFDAHTDAECVAVAYNEGILPIVD